MPGPQKLPMSGSGNRSHMPREAQLREATSHAHGNATVAELGFEVSAAHPTALALYFIGAVAGAER